jgi:phytoene desaturase
MATIAIIGSGFGGLAAAIRLAARGHAVEVFEQRDELGGRAGVYRRQGFTFDAGPTIITAPFLFDELWTLAGKRREDFVRFVPCAPFYRIFNHDGRAFEYDGDERSILEQIGRWNPGDQAGYRRFFAATEPIFRKGFVDLADKPFPRFTDMLRVAPDLIKMRADLSVYQFVSRYIQDDFLRRCFSFHPLLIGGNPFDAPSIYTMIHYLERHWGVHYVMGGTGALVSAMGDLLRDLGGNIHLTAPVAEILVDQRRVTGIRLASGERVLADAVVSNADVAYTYRTLIPEAHRRHNTNRKFESMRYGMSLYVLYFGTNRRYTDTALAHHNILFGPRYAGLLDDIFQRRVLADDFSLYLHMPSRTDPSVAPEGCEAFYVLAPVPHLGADIDWETAARPFRDAIVRFLEDRYLPGLSEAIVTELAVDPRHFAHDLNSYLGAAFSFEPTLTQSAWFRPHNRSEDFDNLYLVGAGTHPGAGLPGVLSSAKIAENLIAASGMPASGTTANGPRTRVRGRLGGKLEASR